MKRKYILRLIVLISILTQGVIQAQTERLLELNVNHIALTITPAEKAIYLIEVTRNDNSGLPIFFSVENPDPNVLTNLSPNILIGKGIVKLEVSATSVSNDFNQFPLEVIARTDSANATIERRIKMWLFVVQFPPNEKVVTIAVKPETPLKNGEIQPIEGRIVPYAGSDGDIRLQFVGPDNNQQEVTLPVDSLGLFSHNRVYRQPGPWQAAVNWVNDNNQAFVNQNSIFFEVSRRTPKIVVTTRNSRKMNIGSILPIIGQIAMDIIPPESPNSTVRIQVKAPFDASGASFDTTMFAITDSKGRFKTSYRVKKTGEHRIVASVVDRSGGNAAPSTLNATTTANVGSSSSHLAIIIIGGSDGLNPPFLDKQNRIAAFVYAKLNERNFNRGDVLILGQSDCIEGFLTRDAPACAYTTKIAEFLSSKGDPSNKHLFVYTIGRTVDKGAAKALRIFDDANPPDSCVTRTFQNLAIDLTAAPILSFAKLTYVAEFDYAGLFLAQLDDRIPVAQKATDIASTDASHPVNLDTWLAPEMSLSGKFMNQIRAGRTIDFAFYNVYRLFPQLPNLDDNGPAPAIPNGLFLDKNAHPGNIERDGIHSERRVGTDPGSVDVDLEADLDTEASPAGVLLKDWATILVSLDNFNSFEIETVSATIYPPPDSNLTTLQVPLRLSSASDLYKSSVVPFFESGTYTIEVNISYSDGSGQRLSSFLFEKRRFIHPDGNQPPIRNLGT